MYQLTHSTGDRTKLCRFSPFILIIDGFAEIMIIKNGPGKSAHGLDRGKANILSLALSGAAAPAD